MSKEEILAREQRWSTAVFVSPLLAVALLIASSAITASNSPDGTSDAAFLANFDENSGPLLFAAILQGLSLLLLAPPLMHAFRAAAARSEKVRPGLVGITVAGPVFLAIGSVVVWAGFEQAAAEFLDPSSGMGVPISEHAEDVVRDETILVFGQGLSFAGSLGLGGAMLFTGIYTMRTGLTTRFWGTLGAALGALIAIGGLGGVLIYLLLPSVVGVVIFGWFVMLGLVGSGRLPGGNRPPGWEAGEARPWPKPGEEPVDRSESEEEPALPAGLEDSEETESEGEDGDEGSEPRRKKRKRRR